MLNNLHADILFTIMNYLKLADLASLSKSSKTLYLLTIVYVTGQNNKRFQRAKNAIIQEKETHNNKPWIYSLISVLDKSLHSVIGYRHLQNSFTLFWMGNKLQVTDRQNPNFAMELKGHNNPIKGALVLSDTRLSLQLFQNPKSEWEKPYRHGLYLYLSIENNVTYHYINDKNSRSLIIPDAILANHADKIKIALEKIDDEFDPKFIKIILSYVREKKLPLPTPSRILTWSDNTLKVWEIETNQNITIQAGKSPLNKVIYPDIGGSKTPRYIYSLSQDNSIRIWNPNTFAIIAVLQPRKCEYDSLFYDLGEHLPICPPFSFGYSEICVNKSGTFYFGIKGMRVECVSSQPEKLKMGTVTLYIENNNIYFKTLSWGGEIKKEEITREQLYSGWKDVITWIRQNIDRKNIHTFCYFELPSSLSLYLKKNIFNFEGHSISGGTDSDYASDFLIQNFEPGECKKSRFQRKF